MTEQNKPAEHPDEDESNAPPVPAAMAKSVSDEMDMVKIINRLPQSLDVAVDHGNGPQAIKLPPHGSSAPVKRSSVTALTHRLIQQGHAKLRQSSK